MRQVVFTSKDKRIRTTREGDKLLVTVQGSAFPVELGDQDALALSILPSTSEAERVFILRRPGERQLLVRVVAVSSFRIHVAGPPGVSLDMEEREALAMSCLSPASFKVANKIEGVVQHARNLPSPLDYLDPRP